MNTRVILVTLSMLAVLILSSCGSSDTSPISVDPSDSVRVTQWVFGDNTVVPLIAGQNYTAGELTVHNNYDTIFFDIVLFDDWFMSEAHIQVADDYAGFPQTKKGTPIPGQFGFSKSHFAFVPALERVTSCCVRFAVHAQPRRIN